MALTTSVALCTYNGAAYLEDQLASILAQSVVPQQIVISDDGSTDGTVALCEDFAARVNREEHLAVAVEVHTRASSLGVTKNFESAIARCTGDVVVLCDQDDVWHVDRVATALAAFDADPELLLHHADALLVDAGGRRLAHTLFESLEVSEREFAEINGGGAVAVYLRRNLVTGAIAAFRRTLFELARPLPAEWVHDEWLAIVAALHGNVRVERAPLIDYRQHGANQIGVRKLSLAQKLRKVASSSGERNEKLAERCAVLVERSQSWALDAGDRERLAAKYEVERMRAAMPVARLARLASITRMLRGGAYAEYASQGRKDALRDLLRDNSGKR